MKIIKNIRILLYIWHNLINGGETGSTGVKKLEMRSVDVMLHVKPRHLKIIADDYYFDQAVAA